MPPPGFIAGFLPPILHCNQQLDCHSLSCHEPWQPPLAGSVTLLPLRSRRRRALQAFPWSTITGSLWPDTVRPGQVPMSPSLSPFRTVCSGSPGISAPIRVASAGLGSRSPQCIRPVCSSSWGRESGGLLESVLSQVSAAELTCAPHTGGSSLCSGLRGTVPLLPYQAQHVSNPSQWPRGAGGSRSQVQVLS